MTQEVTMTKEVRGKIEAIKKLEVSKSEKIRQIYDLGLHVSEVAKELGIRPQFVDNVIEAHVGRENMRRKQGSGDSWSAKFRVDFEAGMKVSEVARKHNKSDSFVHNVHKKWMRAQETQEVK
jgi:transposase-like protein